MVKQQCLFGTLLSIKVPGRHFLFPESWRKGVKMTEPNRQSGENEERIIEIEIERLRPFKEHPFQVKDATLVTSYKNWQSMGRQVMKGEKGITIIAPAPYKKMKEKEVLDENQRPIMGTDGKPKTEQVEVTVPHFKAATVFDIAQTSGEPIQTLAPELLTAAVQDFDSFMQAIQKISPVPIRFDEIDGNANGYYHNADKEIVIKKGLSESQTLKTAIHETAHAKLHDKEIMESLGVEKDRLTKEVGAAAGK